ncbi:MAG: hypothetical protein DHS20C11_36550 [Lysobacteraceae bacterium]|nr:MAG: hypothetical protein DHS20C11_36550 [Xanthomonadaceae bacterium]
MSAWIKNISLGLKATGLALVTVGGLSLGLAATTYTVEWANDVVFEAGASELNPARCLVE